MSQESGLSKSKQVYPGVRKPDQIPEISKKKQMNDQGDKQKKNGIEVICRIRPQLTGEKFVPYKIKPLERNEIEINETFTDSTVQKKFRFNAVLDQDVSQEQIQQEFVVKIIQEMFQQKKSALIFSYGVTNSGKTFTIVGNDENPGVLPQTLKCILQIKEAIKEQKEFHVIGTKAINFEPLDKCSLFDLEIGFQAYEIYKEDIYDLLQERKYNKEKIKLQIKENGDRKFTVRDGFQIQESQSQIVKIQSNKFLILALQTGKWVKPFQICNQVVLTLYLRLISNLSIGANNNHEKVLEQSLCIVDLAGSERSKKAETQGSQLNEACNINKSLLVLGRCLKMLKFQPTESHIVPFRECKLTRVLCEYFTEDNNILMIVNIRLTSEGLDETLKVLNFGTMGVHITLLKSRLGEQPVSFRQLKQDNEEYIEEQKVPQKDFENQYYKVNLFGLTSCAQNIKTNISCLLKTLQIDQMDQQDQIKQILNQLNGETTSQSNPFNLNSKSELNKNSEQNISFVSNELLDKKANSLTRNSNFENIMADVKQSSPQQNCEVRKIKYSLETIEELESPQQSSLLIGNKLQNSVKNQIISELVGEKGMLESQYESFTSRPSSLFLKEEIMSTNKKQLFSNYQNDIPKKSNQDLIEPKDIKLECLYNSQEIFADSLKQQNQQQKDSSILQNQEEQVKQFDVENSVIESMPMIEPDLKDNLQQEQQNKLSIDSLELFKIVEYQNYNQVQFDQQIPTTIISEQISELSKKMDLFEPFNESKNVEEQDDLRLDSQKFYSFGNSQVQSYQEKSVYKNFEQLQINDHNSTKNDSLNSFECSNLFEGLSNIVEQKEYENIIPCFGDQFQKQQDLLKESRVQKSIAQLSVVCPKSFFQQLKFMQTTQISEQEDFRKKILSRLKGGHQANLDDSLNQENQQNLQNSKVNNKHSQEISFEVIEKQNQPQSINKEIQSRSHTPNQSKTIKQKGGKKQGKKQKQKHKPK